MQDDPYAAPKSFVRDTPGETIDAAFVPGGRRVAAGNGWEWIAQGWSLFRREPGMWIALFVIFCVIMGVANVVPFAGGIATILLGPVMTAGVVAACRSAEAGEPLEIAQLFAGFRHKTGALVAVGALYLAAWAAIFLGVFMVMGAGIGFAALKGMADGGGAVAGAGAMAGVVIALLVVAGLSLPVMMAVWFAAPLVFLHEHAPVDAMKASFAGCLKNVVPFLVYGLVIIVLSVFASLPFLLGWLVLGPVLAGSYHASYRDIYTQR